MRILIPLSLLLSSATSALAAGCFDVTNRYFLADDWDFCKPLSDDLFMYYKPLPDQGNLMLGFHAAKDTFGWTALAMAGNGGMKGAAQIVVRQGEDGEWVAEDRNSQDYVTPALDDSQDVKLLFADQDEQVGETWWGVLMPMNSCDDMDYPIRDLSVYMHWALGQTHSFAFHGTRRGQFHVNLFKSDQPAYEGVIGDSAVSITSSGTDSEAEVTTGNVKIAEVRMPNVTVVLGEGGKDPTNPYICSVFELADLIPGMDEDTPYAAVRFSPIVNEDSSAYVHHMVLYGCENEVDETGAKKYEHRSVIGECESMMSGCNELKWAWAVGGVDTVMPPGVGVPIGGKGEGKNLFAIQMHYYNPNLHENVIDSSGVLVHYTEEQQPQEAGYLFINGGTNTRTRPDPIPAGLIDYPLDTVVVPSTCTEQSWDGPLNIFGVGHHEHLFGHKIHLEVVRDGENLGHMRYEKVYDFNHQTLEPAEIDVLYPGDQLSLHCTYDTTKAVGEVPFGDGSDEEMCIAAFLYYPKQRTGFGYLPPRMERETCISPATSDEDHFADASRCAQEAYEDVHNFFGFENLVESSFDALFLCNNDVYNNTVMPKVPGICPDCYLTKTCTPQELVAHFQSGVCESRCSEFVGVSVYPNMTRDDNYDQGMYGCGPSRSYYFHRPDVPEFICHAKGDLTQEVELVALTKIEEEDLSETASGGPRTSFGLVMGLLAAAIAV